MSELQAEAADTGTEAQGYVIEGPEEVAEREPEAEAEAAELAPAGSEETEENTEAESGDESKHDSVQKAINKQYRRFREEERARMKVEKELEEARERLAKLEKPADIAIPPMPNSWDDDYDEKVRARDEAILRKAQADTLRQAEEDRIYRTQQEQQFKKQQETQKKLKSYAERAAKHGIRESDLESAVTRVVDSGISADVAAFLLDDEDGGLMTVYLADEDNVMELYELAGMSPVKAGAKLTQIKAKAAAMKKQASKTPPPPEIVSGKGVPEGLPASLRGTIFE